MADNNKTFQELLIEQRTTNEKLSALNSDNKTIGQLLKELKNETAKPDSVSENIAGALPEILSDRRIAKQREKYDEREKITEIDDEIRNLQEYNIMGFDDITKAIKDTLLYEQTQDKRERREELSGESDGEIIANKLDEIEKNKDLEEIGKEKTSFFGGLTGALAGVSLGGLITGIGKGLLKGGLYGIIGAVIGDELAYRVDSPFFKEAFSKAIPAGALGLAFGGLPGALLGIASTGLFGLYEYIAGETDSISTYDWGSAALGTVGAAYLGGPKLKKALEQSKYGPIKSLGAALRFTPFLVATGIAIALGAGLRFISNRLNEYENDVLKRANELTSDLNLDNLGETLKEGTQTGGRIGGLMEAGSKETETLRKSSEILVNQYAKDKQLEFESISTATQSALALLKIDSQTMNEILEDVGKRKDLFETINNLTFLASKDQLENSDVILKDLLILQDTITKTIDGNSDILESASKLNTQKIEQEELIGQMEKELQDKMKEYGIEKIVTGTRGGGEEMRELRAMENDIKEQKEVLKDLNTELETLKIGESGMGVSIEDVKKILTPDLINKLTEQSIVSSNNDVKTSLDKNTEAVDKLAETIDKQKNGSVSQNTFVGGTRTNMYNNKNNVILNKNNKPNDPSANAVSSSLN